MDDEKIQVMSGRELMLHLFRLLYSGAEGWNNWRKENPDIKLDFSGQKFEGILAANLNDVDFSDAKFIGANFRSANLRGANFRNSELWDAYLNGSDLQGADFSGATLIRTNLAATKGAILTGACLSGADLSKSEISGDLAGIDITIAKCDSTKFVEANLQRANAGSAIFNKAVFDKVSLVGANLMGANFSLAEFRDVDFTDATIGLAIFANNDLSRIKGLDTLNHRMPSTIGIDTIYSSKGNISEIFLRGCGVPDEFITQIPALVGAIQPIQFYSCFISYSHKDEEFANRLYSRMRDANLRVWYAPEEMKGGEKLHEQIFSAIQVHDKLLLVLSENSLQSEWVITEIRRARKTEREENRRKLFPIRLIDFDSLQKWECFDADSGKDLAVELREYYIPDFVNWKEHDAFEAAFDKLLRDLKASE